MQLTSGIDASLTDIVESIDAAATISGDVELLNNGCFCISLDAEALHQALESHLGAPGLAQLIGERCPHVFAARPVFTTSAHAEKMAEVIRAIESVVAMPAYRDAVLVNAPAIARHNPGGAKGVFYGYDFHVAASGIGLIEINTNAGGAMLNAVLAHAQRACCAAVRLVFPQAEQAGDFERRIVDMFQAEWALSNRERPLRSIAIVDDAPENQYLYPEFLLFQQLFQQHGLQAVITDPAGLQLRDGVLWHGDTQIDMVYNRLTDFMLEDPASAALRQAYLAGSIVLTPHPQAHALYADKRNLVMLTDPATLVALGVPEDVCQILLANIPRTEIVSAENAERLWAARRRLFFKPAAGYGGRAAYRGDKLTKRVWEEILTGEYVAQAIVAPGQRTINDEPTEKQDAQVLKFDIRNYVYEGAVQAMAARLYQGQTTNFRTPGGGFAPVYSLPQSSSCAGEDCGPFAVGGAR